MLISKTYDLGHKTRLLHRRQIKKIMKQRFIEGVDMEIKREREIKGGKKNVDTKLKVHWPHTPPRDGDATKMFQMMP